ncbi:MAG TPA: hypothetical protein VFP23_07435 [Solirubrobacterales bacterium]|nr:hypothetical protein [Solirubrobacterales bacterium]
MEPNAIDRPLGRRAGHRSVVPSRFRRRAALSLLVGSLLLGLAGGAAAPPPPAAAAECNGDECEAPPPAPEDPTPGTAVVEGPSNPPVRFPRAHHRKHRHHHKKTRHRGR